MRDLQGQDAGEGVHADVVFGPVVHWGERHHVGVFHLAEGELGVGLGPVAGDDFGGGPVVVVGDQHVFAEDFLFQGGARVVVDAPGQAEVFGFVAGQLPGDDPTHPRIMDDLADLGLDLGAGPAGAAAGQGGGQVVELPGGLGQDRKSTRLNSSHSSISYAVFCL